MFTTIARRGRPGEHGRRESMPTSLPQRLQINGYWAATDTPGVTADTNAYRAEVRICRRSLRPHRRARPRSATISTPRWASCGGTISRAPSGSCGSAREQEQPVVRRYTYQFHQDYVTNSSANRRAEQGEQGDLHHRVPQQRRFHGGRQARLTSSLPRNFTISASPRGRPEPGPTPTTPLTSRIRFGQQHRISGTFDGLDGSLYNGTKKELTYAGRVIVQAHFAFEPTMTLDWVRLPYGNFDAPPARHPHRVRRSTPDARELASSSTTTRRHPQLERALHLGVHTGSQLFLVYSDGHDLASHPRPSTVC